MANLSSEEIAQLVGEIRTLRKALDGTLVDANQVEKLFDAATNGLLTPAGTLDTAKWEAATANHQAEVQDQLSKLREQLAALKDVYSHEDGPADERSYMYKEYASNRAIVFLTALALVGLFADLSLICHEWEAATAGTRGILEFGTPSKAEELAKINAAVTPTPTASPTSSAASISASNDLSVTISPTASPSPSATPIQTLAQANAPAPAPTPRSPVRPSIRSPAPGTTTTAGSTSNGEQTKEAAKEPSGKVTEQAVLWMVILLGGLGGFLYLASSMATYVGNRQLLRSWIVYYILIPFQGAALAPLIYLLLRVGVLNPANPATGGRPMESLNLIGIYGFAALTGLFSKQAIEMMADVFATIFKKVNAKDSLEKSKTEKEKTGKADAG